MVQINCCFCSRPAVPVDIYDSNCFSAIQPFTISVRTAYPLVFSAVWTGTVSNVFAWEVKIVLRFLRPRLVKRFVKLHWIKPVTFCYAEECSIDYSLTSPYGHLYNTDTSLLRTVVLVPEIRKPYIPYLYNTDTSVKRTLGSVPLVSVLKRFDCIRYLRWMINISVMFS